MRVGRDRYSIVLIPRRINSANGCRTERARMLPVIIGFLRGRPSPERITPSRMRGPVMLRVSAGRREAGRLTAGGSGRLLQAPEVAADLLPACLLGNPKFLGGRRPR